MKVEFIGIYKKHTFKKTKSNNDYVELNCFDNISNKNVVIFIFKKDLFNNLEMFKDGDDITVIFETWYSKKENKQVLIVKDVVPC